LPPVSLAPDEFTLSCTIRISLAINSICRN
jgi:hypothetical protein